MKLIFRLNGSWIITDFMQSLFHFDELLYLLGFGNIGNMPTEMAATCQVLVCGRFWIRQNSSAFIQAVPLQVHYSSEALPTQHGYCVTVSHLSATPPHATLTEGLAKGPYVVVRAGFDAATLHTPNLPMSHHTLFYQHSPGLAYGLAYSSEALPTQHGYCVTALTRSCIWLRCWMASRLGIQELAVLSILLGSCLPNILTVQVQTL